MSEERRPHILTGKREEPPAPRDYPDTDPSGLWTVLVGLGVALAFVGWVDIGLLWWPPKFGDTQWEFVIITNFFDALPVATVGTSLLLLGVMAKAPRRLTNVATAVLALLVALLIALAIVYLLDVPLALKGTPVAAKSVIRRSVLKTAVFAVTYTAYYAWLGWFLWGKTRPAKI